MTLFTIEMAGTGSASFSGIPVNADAVLLINGGASLIGEGQVTYEAPSVPEPSTLSLLGIAGIALILGRQFRRSRA
jgi:hypothetical protein